MEVLSRINKMVAVGRRAEPPPGYSEMQIQSSKRATCDSQTTKCRQQNANIISKHALHVVEEWVYEHEKHALEESQCVMNMYVAGNVCIMHNCKTRTVTSSESKWHCNQSASCISYVVLPTFEAEQLEVAGNQILPDWSRAERIPPNAEPTSRDDGKQVGRTCRAAALLRVDTEYTSTQKENSMADRLMWTCPFYDWLRESLGDGACVIRTCGATVAERLARSPPTKANRVQSLAGSPDFRKWESCRTMPLVGGFSWGSPVSLSLSFRRLTTLILIALISSQYVAVKIRPYLFTSIRTRGAALAQPLSAAVTTELNNLHPFVQRQWTLATRPTRFELPPIILSFVFHRTRCYLAIGVPTCRWCCSARRRAVSAGHDPGRNIWSAREATVRTERRPVDKRGPVSCPLPDRSGHSSGGALYLFRNLTAVPESIAAWPRITQGVTEEHAGFSAGSRTRGGKGITGATGDAERRIQSGFASTRKALNWRAVFLSATRLNVILSGDPVMTTNTTIAAIPVGITATMAYNTQACTESGEDEAAQNSRVGGAVVPRENPLADGNVRYVCDIQKSGRTRQGSNPVRRVVKPGA
ncbi:hypothetical protein PR048_027642 [Dryococelus australis]|uniref:Uncharacterized protein n=1 Tax=Dryococelus australis TaxID=614101 RepID=A0ABQ9GH43_9NEOP|nr:hypothetical protein PR048_027642 [Dryococelus australis]